MKNENSSLIIMLIPFCLWAMRYNHRDLAKPVTVIVHQNRMNKKDD